MEKYTRRLFVAGAAAVLSGCLGSEDGESGEYEGAPVHDNTSAEDEEGDGDRSDGAREGARGGSDNATDAGADEPDENTTDEGSENGTDEGETDGETTEDGVTTDELDLREANVMAATFGQEGDGTYTFDVTLYHDDDGEDGYANWWQVESLGGDCLRRRELAHPHGTRRFTRSETIETGDETCVVVRGHDQTHGYGGRAVLVNLETAETRGFFQSEEPSPFDEGDCP